MTKVLKTILVVSLISLPFWWAMNALEKTLEDFFFSRYYQPSLSAQNLFLSAPSSLEIDAEAAVSVRISPDGKSRVLFSKNSSKILSIASLTKLMTAWVVFEHPEIYDLSRTVSVSGQAVEREGDFGLTPGQAVSIKDLLYSMLIESSNDAAYALAESLGLEEFLELMNSEANENLDMANTYFITPSGLEIESEDGLLSNYSSADDLVKLSRNILNRHPDIFEISSLQSAYIFGGYLAVNKNEILLEERVVGAKTGWTPAAGGCIVSVVNDGQDRIINVILGTDSPESRFIEMEKLIEAY